MHKTLFLATIFIISSCNRMKYEQRLVNNGKITCGWFGTMTPEDRLKVFPFSEAKAVYLISFPDYEIDYKTIYYISKSDSMLSPWGEKLQSTNVTYLQEKPKTKITRPILDTFIVFDRVYSVYERVKLNQSQIDSLSNLVLNFKRNKRLKYEFVTQTCCYKPQNAIVFFDGNGKPILNYELCFECQQSEVFPFNSLFNGQECHKIDLYKDFFRQCNIHYGIDSH